MTYHGTVQDLPEPQLSAETRAAFDVAYNNIKAFHAAQKSKKFEVETMPGVWCSREARPIGMPQQQVVSHSSYACRRSYPILELLVLHQKRGEHSLWVGSSYLSVCWLRQHFCAEAVGLYVPGGTAVLPSSTLMLAVPAGLAGCETIVMATPPRPDGSITPEVLYCAKRAGVTHVLKAGGAQAVAAMAWGTKSCPKVNLQLKWLAIASNVPDALVPN